MAWTLNLKLQIRVQTLKTKVRTKIQGPDPKIQGPAQGPNPKLQGAHPKIHDPDVKNQSAAKCTAS